MGYDLLGRMVAESMPGLSTTYTYDNHNRLTYVHSSNSTGYQCTYDSIGRITSRKDLLPDSKYLLREYTYNKGHISTIKYTNQNGVIGTENYSYAYGVLNKIDFSGHSVWELNAENDMGLHISENLGSLLQGYTYDDHMHPSGIAVLKGRKFMYRQSFSIDPNTGNMLSRKDEIRGKEETFEYDAVNRLTNYSGNRMGYDDKGNILYKSDANLWMLYDDETRPYAATGIGEDYSTALVKSTPQRITYNAFECPDSIIDNDIITTFVYNAAGERVMMKTSRTNLPDRYYVGNLYMEHHTASSTTYSLFLGGDAYSAPAVYIVGKNGGTLYYIGRDYLGSIVALYKENGDKAFEYSYDPWGNLRDPATHRVYSQGENQTTILNRGFCGHEYLWWCGLINMNARLYDPSIGRFISPDPYVQAPDFSQNYNRYSYCLNNPLKYTDPSGELFVLDDVLYIAIGAAIIGGVTNLIYKANNGQINSFWDGAKAFGIGFVAGGAGAAAGAYAFVAAGGSLAVAGSGGFLAGAAGGVAGSAVSVPIESFGNHWAFGDDIMSASDYFISVATAGLIGGGINGCAALNNGGKFWNGETQWGGQMHGHLYTPTPDELPAQVSPEAVAEKTMQSSTFPEGFGTNSVYYGVDKDGIVRYVGITEREPIARTYEHLHSKTMRADLFYHIIDGTGSLSRIQARIIEQNLINTYKLGINGGQLYNKINSISPRYWNRFGIILNF